MTSAMLLTDGYGRIHQIIHRATAGLSTEQLATRLEPGSNSIAWLIWHLTRIQDDHLAEVAGREQVWIAGGHAARAALGFEDTDTGYGHGPEEVAAVRLGEDELLAYHDAVFEQSHAFLETLTDADLERIVDASWDPPVTLGVRLVSVLSDNLQHAGQAAFLRGILERA